MEKFDFRDMIGGAPGKVEPDDKLADGANADGALGLCAHMLEKREDVMALAELLARSIIANANHGGICAGALLALVVERVRDAAEAEAGEGQAMHVVVEVASRLGDVEFDERG